jgi:hypothetical protein
MGSEPHWKEPSFTVMTTKRIDPNRNRGTHKYPASSTLTNLMSLTKEERVQLLSSVLSSKDI